MQFNDAIMKAEQAEWLLRVALAPLVVTAIILTSRHFGARAAGRLMGLPLSSGPVSVLLAIGQGRSFAAKAAVGSIASILAVGFSVTIYAAFALHRSWWPSAAAGVVGFLLVVVAFLEVNFPLWAGASVAVAFLFALRTALILYGKACKMRAETKRFDANLTRKRIPSHTWLRITVISGVVILVPLLSSALGPTVSAVVAATPILAMIILVQTHLYQDSFHVLSMVTGILTSCIAGEAFFVVVASTLERISLVTTYIVAIATTVVVSSVAKRLRIVHDHPWDSASEV